MIVYEITAKVNKELAEKFEEFIQETHIPDLLNTGRFIGAEISRYSEFRYRIRYEAADKTSIDEYLNHDATRLRQDFLLHFPSGVELSREILGVLQTWRID